MAEATTLALDEEYRGALAELLDFAIEIAGADFADIRLVDPASGRLHLVVQRGFPAQWARFWAAPSPGPGACLLAFQHGARIVVEDIDREASLAGLASTDLLRSLGVRSLQPTPVVARSGVVLGAFSTHSCAPGHPDGRALRLLDLLARQVADMVERRHAETALVASEDHRQFIHELGDALRPLDDPAAIEFEACRRLAARLGAARTCFVQVDEEAGSLRIERDCTRAGIASIAGTHRIADHEWALKILRRDASIVVSDVEDAEFIPTASRRALAALGTVAAISVPLVEAGRLVGALNVSDDRRRDWSAADFALVRDVGERIWAASERARAEAARREGAGLFRGIFEHSPVGIGVLHRSGVFESANASFCDRVGYALEELCTLPPQTLVHPKDRALNDETFTRMWSGQVEVSVAVGPDPWLVEADPGEVDSAIINLSIDARDAMPSGGRLDLSVGNVVLGEQEARRLDLAPGPHVRICVANTGTGMDAEVLRRATEPFFTTKPQGEGTALGLSSVYGFVRQSGGGLGIESQPGRGTTVTLLLPRSAPRAGTAATGGDLDDMPAGLGERVLVVEDNDQVRRAVAGRLRMLGYDVVEAGRGAEAIAALEGDATIRLVLSDVVMPGGVDGFDVADWARAHRPDVGVLLVSGNMASDPRRAAHPSLRMLARELREALAD
ncbi:MAG: GAF domain-containing protein [Alphaproteobacteria bacterium]|nr:GAF domain-containing protein [Alphaproteobacteria bacterium]